MLKVTPKIDVCQLEADIFYFMKFKKLISKLRSECYLSYNTDGYLLVIAGSNPCAMDNGGCSHICLPAPYLKPDGPKYSCACPDNVKLSNDSINCIMRGMYLYRCSFILFRPG